MSLSTFKRDSNKVMRQLKKTKEPVVLTVNGRAEIVVQGAEATWSNDASQESLGNIAC